MATAREYAAGMANTTADAVESAHPDHSGECRCPAMDVATLKAIKDEIAYPALLIHSISKLSA